MATAKNYLQGVREFELITQNVSEGWRRIAAFSP